MREALELTSSPHTSFASEDNNVFDQLFTVEDILSRLEARFGSPPHFPDDGTTIDFELVCNYLDAMCADPLCTIASTLNGKYVLKLTELGHAIRQLVLEESVKSQASLIPPPLP